MILEEFIAKAASAFPQVAWRPTPGGVVFPAASGNFGDIVVDVAQGNRELIIQFGNFTHGHFDSADSAVACLAEVFAGQLEFYGTPGRGGGFCPRGKRGLLSKWFFGRASHTWSGQSAG